MAQLSKVIGSLLVSIAQAQSEADKASIRLGETYANDAKLRYFVAPRMEVQSLNVQLKTKIISVNEDTNEVEVSVIAEELADLPEHSVSSLSFSLYSKQQVSTAPIMLPDTNQ